MASSTSLQLRTDIQGLRAVAVLGVLAFHIEKTWLPGGFTGVDIFFVISGFLISSIILNKKAVGRFSFRDFYISRIRRIVPAYLILLLVVTIVAIAFLTPDDFRSYKRSLVAALYFNSAQYFGHFGGYFLPSAHELPLQHTWTLAIEMQFYLILPFLLIFLPNKWAKIALPVIAIGLLGWAEYALQSLGRTQETYFALPARMPEFLLGSLIALYGFGANWSARTCNIMGIFGALCVTAGFIIITEDTAFPGVWSLLPCLGACLLIASHRGIVSVVLSLKGMVWIGALSYSVYLWHWPVLVFARYCLDSYGIPLSWLPAIFGLIILLSWLSYVLVENPIRKVGNRGLLVFLLVSAGVVLAIAVPAKTINRSILVDEYSKTVTSSGLIICFNEMHTSCQVGQTGLMDTPYLLIGDSHAENYSWFFDEVGKRNGFSINFIGAASCMPFMENKVGEENCISQSAAAKPFIERAEVIFVAGNWVLHTPRPHFHESFTTFFNDMERDGKTVIIVSDFPHLTANPNRYFRLTKLGLPTRKSEIEAVPGVERANLIMKQITAGHPNVRYLDLTEFPVLATPPYFQGLPTHSDKTHINPWAASQLGIQAEDLMRDFMKSLPLAQKSGQQD